MREIIKLFYISLVFLLLTSVSEAQMIVENSNSEEIFINNGTNYPSQVTFGINTKDESIKFNLFLKKDLISPIYHAIQIKAKAVDGVSSLFQKSKFNPGFSFSYIIGKTHFLLTDKDSKDTNWIFFKIGCESYKYNLFNAEAQFQEQLTKKRFTGLSLQLNHSYLVKGKHLLIFSIGYKKASNFEDLKKIEIQDTKSYLDTITNTQRTSIKTINAREGNFEKFDRYPLSTSYIRIPSQEEENIDKLKLGYCLYFNTLLGEKIKARANFGINLFLTKAYQKGLNRGIRYAIGGIFIELKDAFDAQDRNNGIEDRIVIGLTTRVSINIMQ